MSQVRQRAGLRNNQIVIQTATASDNSFGETTLSFAALATVWAEVDTPAGVEFFDSDAEHTRTPVVFRFLYRTDFDETARIQWGGDDYDIEGIQNLGGRDKLMEVTAVRRG